MESNLSEVKTCKSQTQFKTTMNDGGENEKKKFKNNDCDNFVDGKSKNSIAVKIKSVCDEPLKAIDNIDSHKVGTIWCCDISKLTEQTLNNEIQVLKNSDQDNFGDDKPTVGSIENIEHFCDESLKTIECNNSLKVGTIWCCDMHKLIEVSQLEKYYENFGLLPKIPLISKNREETPKVNIPINQRTQHSVQKNDTFLEVIELLYQKYFNSKIAQNNIIIIANILNVIRMYDAHHKAQMDSLSYIRIGQKPESYSYSVAVSMHLKNSNVLKSKFKKHFSAVLYNKIDFDFELTFQMFFLSIFNILNVLNHQKPNETIFKNLAHLLRDCFKDNEHKTMAIHKSDTFHSNCMDLIRAIEDWQGSDPSLTDRMPIFFMSSINDQQRIFQTIFNYVTSRYDNENLAILIDIAALQCFKNSTFNDYVNITSSATVQ